MSTTTTLPTRYVLAGTSWGEHDHTIRTGRLAVVNAPRPLLGNPTWQGDFLHGVFYAAGQLDELTERWRQDDATLLVEITPQAIMRKIEQYVTSKNYTMTQIAESYDGAIGDVAADLGLPWDDAWLNVPFQPAPKSYRALTGVPLCEHNVSAHMWFVQAIRPGEPLPQDVDMGAISERNPERALTVHTTVAADEGRGDHFQIGYLHNDGCRTADNPALITSQK